LRGAVEKSEATAFKSEPEFLFQSGHLPPHGAISLCFHRDFVQWSVGKKVQCNARLWINVVLSQISTKCVVPNIRSKMGGDPVERRLRTAGASVSRHSNIKSVRIVRQTDLPDVKPKSPRKNLRRKRNMMKCGGHVSSDLR
jgi:hypothetical protein